MNKQKILIVDDEKLIVKGLRFSLEQDGMKVDCAYDGEEALEKARENQYDIILLDIMLPKLTGFEVCQQIREFSPDIVSVNPITGYIYAHKEGTATIYATAKDGSGKYGLCVVKVPHFVPALAVEICAQKDTMIIGETQDLNKTV